MKKIFFAIIAFFLLIIVAQSCKKNGSNSKAVSLTLSNSSVKKGEPFIVTSNQTSSASVIKWSVNPSSNGVNISSSGNRSVILFSNAGQYIVTANYYNDSTQSIPNGSSSSPVIVSDSIYNDSSGQWAQCNVLVHPPLNANDQIMLTPISYSDTGLVFLAQTKDTYENEYPHLDYLSGPDSTSGYEFVFATLSLNPCVNVVPGNAPATSLITLSGLNNGVFDLRFILNGTIYKGEITVTNSNCTFTWNYNSDVTISPLIIAKQ